MYDFPHLTKQGALVEKYIGVRNAILHLEQEMAALNLPDPVEIIIKYPNNPVEYNALKRLKDDITEYNHKKVNEPSYLGTIGIIDIHVSNK